MRPGPRLVALICLAVASGVVAQATCKTATVGQPNSNCFDIWTAAKITQAQFMSYNPGIDCGALQPGQKVCISSGTLPSNAPKPNPDGSCHTYKTVTNDTCSAIAVKFDITVDLIEKYNEKTYKWTGCPGLQRDYTMCVSSGTPPPIPVNPDLQCGPESPGNASCPLNACCSQFGFCGLTDGFCHTTQPNPCIRDCGMPTLPSCGGGSAAIKLAYYAGWGNRRTPCSWANVSPGDIDWTGYTHVHFAFATISQGMQIQLAPDDDALLGELVDQKARYPDLKFVIAVGGWAFSTDDPTRDLFSVMVSTAGTRRTFIDSVEIFLNRYKLNGIDIDFEYPAAIERQGPPEDTPNLTAFFEELRARLAPSKFALSIAAPASYWFLKGFEIDKIAPNLDYINMMSYDYHGPWDVNITDQAPVTNPQSSIKDMRDSALLYVRAKIPLEKTNLGLAYYGRTFKLADPSCKGYGCKLTGTGGGAPGECTITSGYLAQFEIERQLKQNGITAQYDDASKTYWYNFNGDLITFDRQDTWEAKMQFAGESCFAGSFVWSADQVLSGSVGGEPGAPGDPGATPSMTTIVWNPNPYPSSDAKSETFSQSAGVYTVTTRTRVGATTTTATETLTLPAWTETTYVPTVVSGTSTRTTSRITHPASIETSTHAVTMGGTVVTTTEVMTRTATVISLAVPTTTTSIVFPGPPGGGGGGGDDDNNVTIIIAPGGTPVQAPLPPFITPESFITPTWTYHILPPPSASTVTFTAPLTGSITYSTTVPVPQESDDPPKRVDNPPGDKNSCNGGGFFNLLFRALISPCMPLDVGIRIGITPRPIPPPGWTGPWVNPFPIPTPPPPGAPPEDPEDPDEDPDDPEDESCALPPTTYTAPPDPENAGDEADTFLRRRFSNDSILLTSREVYPQPQLVPRAGGRHIQAAGCPNAVATSPNLVSLVAGTFYSVGRISDGTANTFLGSTQVPRRPLGGGLSPQEHVFELGYIDQWLVSPEMVNLGCAWYEDNIFNNGRIGGAGGKIGDAILARIDNVRHSSLYPFMALLTKTVMLQTNNMVWADRAMNQAKSNVVNNNRNDPNHPPQEQLINSISDFQNSATAIYNAEFFARNIAALGSYFSANAGRFRSVAQDVMNILSEITPTSPPHDSKSIPLLFYEWLESTLSAYPQGGVNRANALLRAYQARMNRVSVLTQVFPVPQCFPVFHQGVTASSFNHMNLMPRRPPMSECNPPGTLGKIGVFDDQGRKIIDTNQTTARTMGSGSTFTVGLGSGANLDDWHYNAWVGANPTAFPRCNGAMQVREHDPSTRPANAHTIYLTFGCQHNQGGYPFWVGLDRDGGSYLECATARSKPTGHFEYFCAQRREDAFNCMEDVLGMNPQVADLYDGVLHFFPE